MLHSIGPLAGQMAVHILLMNACAPLGAYLLLRVRPELAPPPSLLAPATLLQLALLVLWHSPALNLMAAGSAAMHLAMQLSLLAAALLFWTAVLSPAGERWRAMTALLATGKIACLIGILLVVAPRALYPGLAAAHAHHGAPPDGLADQQLAGLLMITACPLTYVLAAIVLAARWLREAEDGLQRTRRADGA